VPPENKPTPAESQTCRRFLSAEIAEMPRLRAIVALGRVAHDSVIARSPRSARSCPSAMEPCTPRQTDAVRELPLSRYNTNTGRLTPTCSAMFRKVRAQAIPSGS